MLRCATKPNRFCLPQLVGLWHHAVYNKARRYEKYEKAEK